MRLLRAARSMKTKTARDKVKSTIYLGILYSEAVWRKVACTVVTLRFL